MYLNCILFSFYVVAFEDVGGLFISCSHTGN